MTGKFYRCAMRILDGALAVMVGLLVLDVLLGVASRYLWGAQVKWTEELATLLLVYVSIFGIAAAFDRSAHLGIDALTSHFDAKTRKQLALSAHVVTLAFVVIVFEIGGWMLVRQAVVNWNVLPALQVSDVVMFLPLPLGGLFVLLSELRNLLADARKDFEHGTEGN